MALEVFANDTQATVTSGGTGAPSPGTVETWTVVVSSPFPTATSGATQFHVADPATGMTTEKILVTAGAGTAGSHTWTVTRGADGTTPVAHAPGFTAEQIVTAAWLASAKVTDWLNVAADYGADPTGATDSTTAIQTALSAAAVGQMVYMPTGTYQTSAPLLVPPGVVLAGPVWSYGTPETGAIIKPSASFAQGGAPAKAAVIIADKATEGYAIENTNAGVCGVVIDGTTASAGTDGLSFYGTVQNPWLEKVHIYTMPVHGISFGTSTAGSPDGVHLADVKTQACGQEGIYAPAGTADMWWTRVHSTGNGTAGTYSSILVYMGGNSSFSQCRAEWASKYGWEIHQNSTASGGASFSQCSTDRNTQNGFFVTGTGTAAVVFSNCFARRDGRNGNAGGGGYAGVRIDTMTAPVVWEGCSIKPGVDDNGSGTESPDYGVVTASAGLVSLGRGYYHAHLAPLLLDTASVVRVAADAQLHLSGGTATSLLAPTLTAQAGAGTGAAISSQAGTDAYGQFTLTVGTSPASGAQVILTYATARSNDPAAVLVQCWNNTSNVVINTVAPTSINSTTSFNFYTSSALAAASNYRFTYQVIG